jgi:hypothetical protein
MKTYRGERTERGCEVTVDGKPLRMRSDLSGNATTAFDWGYVGTGQLSLALLSDLLGSDRKAKAMSDVFEEKVIAELPPNSWTMTEYALATALAPLVGVDGARADDHAADATAGAAFGDTPVESSDPLPTTLKAEDAAANTSMVSEGGHLVGAGDMPIATSIKMKSPNCRAASEAGSVVNNAEAINAANRTAEEAIGAANRASDAAAVAKAAHQAAHAGDTPADEAMSTANRAADHKAYAANRAADETAALARKSVDEVKRVLAKTLPKIGYLPPDGMW